MDARTKSILLLALTVVALAAGVGLVVVGTKLQATIGVVLVVIGLVAFMPAMNFLFDAMGGEPANEVSEAR